MSYKPFETLVTQSEEKSELWRFLVGCLFATAIYIAVVVGWMSLGAAMMGIEWTAAMAQTGARTSPDQIIFILFSFIGMTVGVFVTLQLLHGRNLSAVTGKLVPFTLDFFRALRGLVPVVVLTILFGLFAYETLPNVSPWLWISLLPISLLTLFIQVSAEEVAFRGYLQVQMAALGLPRILWILLPSLLFGIVHYDPATLKEAAPWIVLWAAGFGILAADLTARTGNLGAAVAFHFSNNFVALLVFGVPDHLGGLTLFSMPFSVSDIDQVMAMLPLDAISLIVAYLAARLSLRV